MQKGRDLKTLEEYRELVEDRPLKWTAEDVGYRRAESGEPACKRCKHFFERRLDKFGVCEIFRSEDTDEEGVDPNWTCSFNTLDMKKFPLLEEK